MNGNKFAFWLEAVSLYTFIFWVLYVLSDDYLC